MHALWSKISPRERRLAIATASVIVLSAVWFVSLKALSSLDLLDGTIGAIRQELAYQEELARQADTVDRAFNGIATEHSSRWTQEEIHDRLRLEITRLAAENVPPPGAPVPAGSPTLVKFKSLPSGVLYPGGKGYRQYHIELQTQPTSIKKLTTFLERLQESKQALRVDRLEIRRPPEANQVTADIGVTRTVIDADLADQVSPAGDAAGSPPAGANLVRNPSFEAWDEDSATFRHWGADRLDIGRGTMGASDGALCLTGRALAAGAAVYQRQESWRARPMTSMRIWRPMVACALASPSEGSISF